MLTGVAKTAQIQYPLEGSTLLEAVDELLGKKREWMGDGRWSGYPLDCYDY